VNLCTSTQTYSLRQVQSSNSIFLIKPLSGAGNRRKGLEGDGDATIEGDGTGLGVGDTVTAVAQCKATLELQKLEARDSAIAFLRQSLRLYDQLPADADALRLDVGMADAGRIVMDIEKQRTKTRAFADVPLSTAECERGWVEICGFVHDDPVNGGSVCLRPSASVKLEMWKRIIEGSVLQGINLAERFLVRNLWKAVVDGDATESSGEDPFPKGLFDAVVRRLTFKSSSETCRQDLLLSECKFSLVFLRTFANTQKAYVLS
jgi:hypothetical protein